MKSNLQLRQRPPWTRRFFFPALLVFTVWAILEFSHAHAWKLGIPTLTMIAAWVGGLGGFFFIILSPLFTYPRTYFRKASLVERAIATLTPLLAECTYHTILAGSVFSLGETLYYGIGHIFVFVLCINLCLMGICEVLCRLRQRSRQTLRVLSPGPIIAILLGPLAAWIMLIWDGGVHWFYLYQEGYKLLFW